MEELLRFAMQNGPGTVMALLVGYFYRKDVVVINNNHTAEIREMHSRHQAELKQTHERHSAELAAWTKRFEDVGGEFRLIIQDNTRAITALTKVIEHYEGDDT